MTFDQLWILLFSGGCIYLLAQGKVFWGNIVGLLATPGYIYTTALNAQWAMFALALWWGACHAHGIWRAR